MTFTGVHFNHPWITFFEKVIVQKTHTHTKVTFSYIYVFRLHSCDYRKVKIWIEYYYP